MKKLFELFKAGFKKEKAVVKMANNFDKEDLPVLTITGIYIDGELFEAKIRDSEVIITERAKELKLLPESVDEPGLCIDGYEVTFCKEDDSFPVGISRKEEKEHLVKVMLGDSPLYPIKSKFTGYSFVRSNWKSVVTA